MTEDFIRLYHGLYPEGYCQFLINEFERLVAAGAGYTRQRSENIVAHRKCDMQLRLNFAAHSVAPFKGRSVTDIFFEGLQEAYEDYTSQFSVLHDGNIVGTEMKMQRTDPGEGYHIWHAEQGNASNADRVVVYMLYLNNLDLEDGGETEFLYQRKRIRPEANTMLLWPAGFTHAHRGNTVLGNKSKYVVTGWFYYE